MLGDAAMLFASWIYGAYLTKTPMRTLFFVLQLFNAAASTFNLMVSSILCHGLWCFPVLLALVSLSDVGFSYACKLALGTHNALSVPSRVFAPLGNIAFWMAWQVQPYAHDFSILCFSSTRITLISTLRGVAAQGTAGLHTCCKDCAVWCGGDIGGLLLLVCSCLLSVLQTAKL
eukprot:COSAG02_NODE_2402_length_8943_cov_2.854138_9_plen_174_part_00